MKFIFNVKYFFIFLFVFVKKIEVKQTNKLNLNSNKTICLIGNLKYPSEYLYASNNPNFNNKRRVFTNHLESVNILHANQMIWILNPVKWIKNTFYITSLYYINHHLCASHQHFDSFNHRRDILLYHLNKESLITNKKCMWKLHPVDSNQTYTIWNMNYKEPLYAASFLFKTSKTNQRSVYLWHNSPDSLQFNWNVDCIEAKL